VSESWVVAVDIGGTFTDAVAIGIEGGQRVAKAPSTAEDPSRGLVAALYAVRALLDPHLPSNDGILRALDVVCPLGNVLNPRPPAAVSVRHNTCQRLADTIFRAAAELWPEKAVGASSVTFFGLNVESRSPVTGLDSVLSDVVGGGTGAHAADDGIDGVDTYMSNVGLMPVEVAELNYSVRIRRTELIDGSGGDGVHRGGMGIRREYEILHRPARATFYAEQTDPRFRPRGARGGGDGSPSRITLLGPDGEAIPVPSKVSRRLEPGSIVRIESSGGGGYGRPGDDLDPGAMPGGRERPAPD
jgi:N-methylhydantoinase B